MLNEYLLSWMNELFLTLNCANGPIAMDTIANYKAKESVAKALMRDGYEKISSHWKFVNDSDEFQNLPRVK